MIALLTEPRRILIVKPSALGDVVHTLPILRLLRRRFAGAEISWLIDPAFAGLIEGHPDLNRVVRFDRKRFARSWHSPSAAGGLLEFKANLRDQQYDLVIDLQGLFRSGWLTGYTGAATRVGFGNAREMAQLFYTHRVPIRDREVHAIERYLTLAQALGCDRGPVEFDFAVPDADRRAAHALLAENGIVDGTRFAVMLPGTNWATKRWPAEKFARLAGMLRPQLGLVPVVAGGNDAPPLENAVSMIGKTSLKQLVAVLERAAVVVANDTGPMHIAAALGRPLVALFGPTNPIRTGPYQRLDTVVRLDLPCAPCYSRTCSHQSCLQWMTAEVVLERVRRAIDHAAASSRGLTGPTR